MPIVVIDRIVSCVRESGMLGACMQGCRPNKGGGEPDAPHASDDAVTQMAFHTARIHSGPEKTRDYMGVNTIR